MLHDCIEVFEKQLKVSGDKLIIDTYVPADGTYIIVSLIDGKFSIKEFFDIKYNKKLGELEGRANIYFEDICNYDYNSKLIDMNKPIDSKKIIHSNNYLSFFIKKESLSNEKLTQDIIDNYYKILSNPYLKYTKPKAKEIYKYVEADLEYIDQDLLNKIKEWIKLNIFNLEELGIKITGKDYLKVFFELPIEKYQTEGRRYLIPNIYNSNDFNEKLEEILYGLPNDNINLNSKKPYLENKTRKVKVPYLVNEKQVILQKKFFDYLMAQCSKGNVNIYIDEEKVRSYKNGEMPDSDFNGMYMRIKKGKEVEIHSYDIVTSYKFKLDKPFKFFNVLELGEKAIFDENYGVCNDKKILQEIINNTLFSKYLVNNYYTESKDISIKDNIIKRNLLISRESIFDWIYKGNEKGIYEILNKTSLDLIKNSIKNGYIVKASHQYNLKCSLESYFKGGKSMGDIVYELKNNLREKINSGNTESFSSDEQYYFAIGQFVNYLLSKSKGKNKPHSLANPFINAKSNTVIKEKLRNLYKRYNYDIDMYSKRVKNIYGMIVSYEPEKKVDQDMIIAGYLHSNLIYESNKKGD
ncbi:type I-B CRISPR-associated protein Cas8b/Csh1 [Romboutsia ilealis]|uniref:Type I-B CRISPR-associated protein Cas8b/Csh1 n=1 Tax=Romboutsia faecis TaxID=2764597 RepID=A0ABR7JRY6_9FIRM|nr:type I-B CRISPR-associated protein Cas8b/Csh1 [Romboutsia faecis]MBC5997675.1 type I-B CRISPR-associated protein Cas8b/Csh1 [Romboutsia faecis]MRN25376.1 type I-B CRISPR-associated protein Cas8b/Csh1 [Romboutsia ilealis]